MKPDFLGVCFGQKSMFFSLLITTKTGTVFPTLKVLLTFSIIAAFDNLKNDFPNNLESYPHGSHDEAPSLDEGWQEGHIVGQQHRNS
jgi:hypothetical protein